MNLDAAKRVAEAAKKDFLGPWYLCPFRSCGLIVLVYREHDREAVSGANVAVTGTVTSTSLDPMTPSSSGQELHEMTGSTDSEGIARWLPFYEGNFQVRVTSIPDPDDLAIKLGRDVEVVSWGSCPIVVLPVTLWSRPEVVVLQRHDDMGVAGVTVRAGVDTFQAPTGGGGLTVWTGRPLPPADYKLTFTFRGNDRYRRFDHLNNVVSDTPTIHLPVGRHRFMFKVAKLSWMKVRVREVKPAATTDVGNAKLTLVWPEDASKKPFETAGGVKDIQDIAQVDGPATRCAVDVLEILDDDEPEVFELHTLTTA